MNLDFVVSSKHQSQVKQLDRDWSELPYDVTANILSRVGLYDILENAQKVCTIWHKICKDPAMWRVINMDITLDHRIAMRDRAGREMIRPLLREMCKKAVDRSQGQLVDITIWDIANKELLEYIADRSSRLRRLKISFCSVEYYESWAKSLEKLPLLEELSVRVPRFFDEIIDTASRSCPVLTTLKINANGCFNDKWVVDVLGKNLPEFRNLRNLELIGDVISNIGLQTILDGCRYLELLDLRQCPKVNLNGEFGKKCLDKVKCLIVGSKIGIR